MRLQNAHTESITGTSTSTPTTVASAAPEPAPYNGIAVCAAIHGYVPENFLAGILAVGYLFNALL